MSSKTSKVIFISASIGISMLIIVGATLFSKNDAETEEILPAITSEQLGQENGKDGRKCYVAVDGIVYEIKQGKRWKDGEHDPAEGQAYCGADLSSVIDKSPHGRSILSLAEQVGKLN